MQADDGIIFNINPWCARKPASEAAEYGHARRTARSVKRSGPMNKGMISNTY